LPILNYGCEVWGFQPGKAVERLHVQFCKQLLCVQKNTHNDFVYGDLGRMPLQNIRCYELVKFWLRILQSDNKKYIKIVYTMLYQDILNKPNTKNWCSLLRDLLFALGFVDAWYLQSVGNNKLFLSLIMQRIQDQCLQNWRSRLDLSSRAGFCKHIARFRFQPYLDLVNVSKSRISFSRLRCVSHRLCIEVGRWHRPVSIPVNERLCTTC